MALETFAGSRIAVLVTDDLGRYAGANRLAMSMSGYSMVELWQLPVEELPATTHVSDNRRMLQILLSGPRSLPTNTVLRTKSRGQTNVHLISAKNPYESAELWYARTSFSVRSHLIDPKDAVRKDTRLSLALTSRGDFLWGVSASEEDEHGTCHRNTYRHPDSI